MNQNASHDLMNTEQDTKEETEDFFINGDCYMQHNDINDNFNFE